MLTSVPTGQYNDEISLPYAQQLHSDKVDLITAQTHYSTLNTSKKDPAKLQGQQAPADSLQTANTSTFNS